MADQFPLYRHPTLTVLIEDDQAPSQAMAAGLYPGVSRRRFVDPADAVDWMESALDAVERVGPPLPAAGPVSQSDGLERIYGYVEGPQRFYSPSVVVVGYNRPSGGMQACEAVAHLPCRTVWMSGGEVSNEVVDAFNRGLIDRHVDARADGAYAQVQNAIDDLQGRYFSDRSREVWQREMDGQPYAFLSDGVFDALVQDLVERYGFVEHYFVSMPPGLLFFDGQGMPMLMVVQSEEMMVRQFERARLGGAPAELLRELFECRVVPFFPTDDGFYSSEVEEPMACCRPAQRCMGVGEYYWALFDVPEDFRGRAPFSHAQFMKLRAAEGE